MVQKHIRSLGVAFYRVAFCLAMGMLPAGAGASIAPLSEIPDFEPDPVEVINERLRLFEGAESVLRCLNPKLRENFANAIAPEDIEDLRARVSADNLPEFEKQVKLLTAMGIKIDNKPDCAPQPAL